MNLDSRGIRPTTFLYQQFSDLPSSRSVTRAVRQHERGAKKADEMSQVDAGSKADRRIELYLHRLKRIIASDETSGDTRRRGLEKLKAMVYAEHVIAPSDISDSVLLAILQRRNPGHEVRLTSEVRMQMVRDIQDAQRHSLDAWIDYLTSPEARYPDALKYYAFRSVLKMGAYDSGAGKFAERRKTTIAPFPEINREALGLAFEAIQHKLNGKQPHVGYGIDPAEKEWFVSAVTQGNFARIYGWLVEKFKPISEELQRITAGKWVVYPVGSNPKDIVRSLENYGTGWCIRAEPTAAEYMVDTELHVYYSHNAAGNPAVPRVAMAIKDGTITEVRGIAKEENLDRYMSDVVMDRLVSFAQSHKEADVDSWLQIANDHEQLNTIEQRIQRQIPLDEEDLRFLYAMDRPIGFFGYDSDPRIPGLLARRDLVADVSQLMHCDISQVARSAEEVRPDTVVYIGPLFPQCFMLLRHVEHLYTHFPDEPIEKTKVVLGSSEHDDAISSLREAGVAIQISDSYDSAARINEEEYMFWQIFYPRDPRAVLPQSGDTYVCTALSARDLGLTSMRPSYADVVYTAQSLGLMLCPGVVGMRYAQDMATGQLPGMYLGQQMGIGMESIHDSCRSLIFKIVCQDEGYVLKSEHVDYFDRRYDPESIPMSDAPVVSFDQRFIFVLPTVK